MKCNSINVIFEFCFNCNKVTPFTSPLQCFYCGSHSPFGDFHDESISDSELEEYTVSQRVNIGLISEADINTLDILNNL